MFVVGKRIVTTTTSHHLLYCSSNCQENDWNGCHGCFRSKEEEECGASQQVDECSTSMNDGAMMDGCDAETQEEMVELVVVVRRMNGICLQQRLAVQGNKRNNNKERLGKELLL